MLYREEVVSVRVICFAGKVFHHKSVLRPGATAPLNTSTATGIIKAVSLVWKIIWRQVKLQKTYANPYRRKAVCLSSLFVPG